MYESRFFEDRQRVQELCRENFDKLGAQPTERVLLDELVEIGREQFEDETQMAFVDERVAKAEDV